MKTIILIKRSLIGLLALEILIVLFMFLRLGLGIYKLQEIVDVLIPISGWLILALLFAQFINRIIIISKPAIPFKFLFIAIAELIIWACIAFYWALQYCL